jgi:drug/metabolite transporter (DMT)-like permease
VQTYNLGRVVFWMIGALLSFSAMAVSIRGLAGVLSVFEILAIRSGLGILILLVLGAWWGVLRSSLIPHRFAMHVVRNSLHFAGQFAWASAVLLLPLATVFALEFTAPAWTALLAALLLGERLTPSRIAAIVLGFVGVLIILRPGLESFRPAALLVLAAAVGFASTTIATKMLITTETTFAVVLWMNILQLPMTLVASDLFFPAKLAMQHLPAVLGIGIAGLSAHYCLTNAFRSGDATVVVTIDFLRIPLIAVVGWWFYGEPLDVFVFVGAAVIIGGVLWNLRVEARRPIAPESKPAESRTDAAVGN